MLKLQVPMACLMLYATPFGAEEDDVYPAFHPMVGIPGTAEFRLGEPEPLTGENCARVKELFDKLSRTTSEGNEVATDFVLRKPIPPNMLLAYKVLGSPTCVWWEPSRVRTISHRFRQDRDSLDARVPHMLFVVQGSELTAYALKEPPSRDEDGELKLELYKAPFWNTNANGTVCLGTAKVSMTQTVDFTFIMESYSQAYWGSYFTHGQAHLNRWKKSLYEFWDMISKRKPEKPFPVNMLQPSPADQIHKAVKPYIKKAHADKTRNR